MWRFENKDNEKIACDLLHMLFGEFTDLRKISEICIKLLMLGMKQMRDMKKWRVS